MFNGESYVFVWGSRATRDISIYRNARTAQPRSLRLNGIIGPDIYGLLIHRGPLHTYIAPPNIIRDLERISPIIVTQVHVQYIPSHLRELFME